MQPTRYALTLTTLAFAAALQAETAPAPDAWKHKGNFGLSITSGNADTLRTTFGWNSTKETEVWTYTFDLNAIYGEDEGITSNERLDARFQADRELTERTYLGLSSNFLYDSLADIDYRFGNYAAYGYKFIESDDMNLRVELGPGFIIENRNGSDNTDFAFRFAQFFDWQFTKNTKLFQSLAMTGPMDDPGNYILEAETGIESNLSGPWSLRVAARAIRYGESTGINNADDFLLTAGLGYAFQLNNDELPTIEDAQKNKKSRKGEWVTTALLGGSFASGNSESAAMSVGILSKYETEDTETSLGLTANYAETNSQTTAQTLFLDVHTQRDISESWFSGVRLDGDHNEIADLKYRIYSAPYLGYRIIDSPELSISFEAGPSLVLQQEGDIDDTYLGAYAQLKNRWTLSERTQFIADFAWLADTGSFNDFVLTSTAGIDHSMTDTTKIKLLLTHLYDNTPAIGAEKGDLSVVFGLEFEL